MTFHMYCQSKRHNGTKGNGYSYHHDKMPPQLCHQCGDPWVNAELYDAKLAADTLEWFIKNKQNPPKNSNNEIILEFMLFSDAELVEIINRDKKGDVIKAALAAQLLSLRTSVRPLADYEWIESNKMINAAWVASHITCEVKWVDFHQRGIDPMKIRGMK